MASETDIKVFVDRQRTLLSQEREAEIERSSLLLSNCGPKLLEQKGLSLGGLGIVGMNVGLGGKTFVASSTRLNMVLTISKTDWLNLNGQWHIIQIQHFLLTLFGMHTQCLMHCSDQCGTLYYQARRSRQN